VETFLTSIASEQYEAMATSLIQMGATTNNIDVRSFAVDLEKIFSSIQVCMHVS
jgi:aarF domain-containing kinase